MTIELNTEKNKDGKTVYKPEFGTDLKVAAWNAILLARDEKQDIVLDYNGVQINVASNMDVKRIVNLFFSLSASMGFPQLQKTRG